MSRIGSPGIANSMNDSGSLSEQSLGDQARARIDELAMRAARTERSNKPTILIILSLALLVGTGLFLLSSMAKLKSANTNLSRERDNAQSMVRYAAQLKQLRDLAAEGSTTSFEPDPQLRSRIAQVAVAAGLSKPLPIPKSPAPSKSKDGTAQRIRFQYAVQDPSLAAIMTWLTQTERDIQGVRVYSIKIVPAAEQWTVDVTLSRVERVERLE